MGCLMGDNSKIEWTEATWNPFVGCTAVSPGCDNCYAAGLASGRLVHTPAYEGLAEGGVFNGTIRLLPDRLYQPLRWRRPRRIFVNSMSDLFHDQVPDHYIADVFAVMALARQHTFQVLTKRHGRMRSLLSSPDFRTAVGNYGPKYAQHRNAGYVYAVGTQCSNWPLRNVWLGVSVENQQWADIRIPALLGTPTAVRWVSAEPLLGQIDLSAWLVDHGEPDRKWGIPLDWVVVGGESGSGARPMHPDWAIRLRDQCTAADVPFLFKQWGEWSPMWPLDRGRVNVRKTDRTMADDGTLYAPGDLRYPDGPRYGEALRAGHDRGHLTAMYRVGKRAAGRELDGRVWDEYPEVTHV